MTSSAAILDEKENVKGSDISDFNIKDLSFMLDRQSLQKTLKTYFIKQTI